MEFESLVKNDWWKTSVIYQIFPASFKDSNNDGFGDLQGIISKLDYLLWLGIDAIWLSPVYCSPLYDMGYDISDYLNVDPKFGNMNDLEELIAQAHQKNIKVILDMVMNHTSEKHPWFIESSSSLNNPKRNWYIWKSGLKNKRPNNWKSVFGGSAWEYSSSSGQYYYHTFFKQQPDLNWRNKELRNEFFKIIEFWLNKDIDGFRLDVINMIVKDKKFRNSPPLLFQLSGNDNYITRNRPKSYKIIRKLRELTDTYDNKVLIGEIYALPPGKPQLSASYLSGKRKGLHLAFDFSLMFKEWNARKYCTTIYKWMTCIPSEAWPCHVLSNHDLCRPFGATLLNRHNEAKSKIIAVLLLTLKGTPFIYYGDEIGMQNAKLSFKDTVDPLAKRFWLLYKGRDKARTPMQWDNSLYGGFTEAKPWLPLNKDYEHRNVEEQKLQPESLLGLYRRLLIFRKSNPTLLNGVWTPYVYGKNNILAFYRVSDDEKILVILNFSKNKKKCHIPHHDTHSVLISTHRLASHTFKSDTIVLFPYEASIFKIINLKS